MKKSILAISTIAFLFAACGSPSEEDAKTETPVSTEAPAETPAASEPVSAEATVTINAGDDMKFDIDEIKVKEGQTVKLTLHHSGKMPITAMGHNFVLLANGTSIEDFAKEAINAKDNDYIPKSLESSVITHTKTIGGGESTEISFPAPAKGTYDFLCSFPGHSAMMKGIFIVE
ncbi:MAG: azurin [Chitinophagaceae bacterium]|nr:MAG: blue (type 1) copper domain-containing protein [Bacteroidetes bacterium OLB11]MCC6448534.1 azurin [Chitinophagaceae bacterium]HMN32867.1 azurin [Chitinophagaceae bacterium]